MQRLRSCRVVVLALAVTVVASVACSAQTATAPTTAPAGSSAPGTTARPAIIASAGCTTGAPAATKSQHTDEAITSGGAERTSKRWVPASYTGKTPMPLIIDMHGFSEGSALHTQTTNLGPMGETEGFVTLTPSGSTLEAGGNKIPYWNSAGLPQPDDVGFIRDLLDATEKQLCIDTRRVYATGYSNGGFMTSQLACVMSDRIAAGAPVAGLQFPAGCKASRNVPLIAFHGTEDDFVTFDGHPGAAAAKLPGIDKLGSEMPKELKIQPIPEAQANWAKAQGCSATPTEKQISTNVKLIEYGGCREGSTVQLYLTTGDGHAWPGSKFSEAIGNVVGHTTFEIDANKLMWKFFQEHPLT